MTCEEVRAFLEAVGSEVPRDAACAAHLRTCQECAAYAAYLPAESEAFTRVFSRPVDEESFQRVKATFARRIAPERISSRITRRRVQPVLPARRFGWAIPIAALIAISVLGGLGALGYYSSLPPDSEMAQATPKDKDFVTPPKRVTPLPTPVQPERKLAAEKPVAPEHNEVVKAPAPPVPSRTPAVKPAPIETASANQPPLPPIGPRLTQLRTRIREQMVLDDVEQLTIAFNNSGYPEARVVMEDAELYLERILALEGDNPEDARQTLAASRSTADQLQKIQESVTDETPATLKNALQRTVTALNDAAGLSPDVAPKGEAAVAMAQAEAHYNHAEYADALSGYRQVADHFSSDRRAAHARYTMAFILQKKMNKNDEARSIYQSIADAKHGLSSHASYHIGESYERSGDAAKALAVYEKLVKSPQSHARAASLRDKIAFLEAQQKGTQLAKPGWAKDVPKTLHLAEPRPVKPKSEHK